MKSKLHEFSCDAITITFDKTRCLHAEECVRGARQVFDPARRRWIDPTGADPHTIVTVIERCPTGALHYRRHDGGVAEAPDRVNRVAVVVDGPLYVRGDVRLIREDGEEILRDSRVALCRCGHSSRKPLCDGAHERIGFRSSVVLEAAADPEAGDEKPPLTIRVMMGGPLRIEGPVEITAGGETRVQKNRVALCRCGGSSRKPFCDGSHGRMGFTAE